jgi:hypothetical protein
VDLTDRPGVLRVNLEREAIPAEPGSYDTVLCLDVLEHLENMHAVFDELCRVTSQWLIVSLPNPWSAFLKDLIAIGHPRGRNFRRYGLPVEPPAHRHKWFFAGSEAERFVEACAKKNNMVIVQLDVENQCPDRLRFPTSLADLALLKTWVLQKLLFKKGTYFPDLYDGTRWWVLKKE